ncbi:MAG: hypothetical protein OCU22_09210 [Canidatus Methanoxibalbensis ujae]|nr:hypothetical protein [Candidatus Methanoxibalbensis ujae]
MPPSDYINDRNSWFALSDAQPSERQDDFDRWLEEEIFPYAIVPDERLDTSQLRSEEYGRRLDWWEELAQDWLSIARDTFWFTPWDELPPEERRKRMEDWKRQAMESHVPEWARDLQKWVTTLDDIEDILSSAAWASRFLAFLFPSLAPVLMPLSGALDLAGNLIDIPKDLLALPLGPTGIKKTMEDLGKLLHPKRFLKDLLKKKVPKSLREALPSLGELLEIGQAAHTLTGRGLSLGPLMGHLSNMWFGALESLGITSSQSPHKEPPHHSFLKPDRHGMPLKFKLREVEHETGRTGYRKLQYIQIPMSGPREGKYKRIDLGIEGVFRQPSPMEFWALRTWMNAYNVFAHPGGFEEHVLFKALLTHTITLPWAWRFLADNEWWKVLGVIGKEKLIPMSPAPSFGTEYLRHRGYDPYQPLYPMTRGGDVDITYDELIVRNSEFVSYRIWNMIQRHKGTKQSAFVQQCVLLISNFYAHALNTDPLEFVRVDTVPATGAKYEVYRKKTVLETKDPYPVHALKRLGQWGFRIPEDAPNTAWRAFIADHAAFIKAHGTYPKIAEMTEMLFRHFPRVIWRGEEYTSLEQFLHRNTWLVRTPSSAALI